MTLLSNINSQDEDVTIDERNEFENLKAALKHARLFALCKGVTMRKFAELCKISPTQLSKWTGSEITTMPDVTKCGEVCDYSDYRE